MADDGSGVPRLPDVRDLSCHRPVVQAGKRRAAQLRAPVPHKWTPGFRRKPGGARSTADTALGGRDAASARMAKVRCVASVCGRCRIGRGPRDGRPGGRAERTGRRRSRVPIPEAGETGLQACAITRSPGRRAARYDHGTSCGGQLAHRRRPCRADVRVCDGVGRRRGDDLARRPRGGWNSIRCGCVSRPCRQPDTLRLHLEECAVPRSTSQNTRCADGGVDRGRTAARCWLTVRPDHALGCAGGQAMGVVRFGVGDDQACGRMARIQRASILHVGRRVGACPDARVCRPKKGGATVVAALGTSTVAGCDQDRARCVVAREEPLGASCSWTPARLRSCLEEGRNRIRRSSVAWTAMERPFG